MLFDKVPGKLRKLSEAVSFVILNKKLFSYLLLILHKEGKIKKPINQMQGS
jgi:hypothetical protein